MLFANCTQKRFGSRSGSRRFMRNCAAGATSSTKSPQSSLTSTNSANTIAVQRATRVSDVPAHYRHVQQSGSGWTARCPAHDDARSTLSIGKGNDGRWLLKCHAGCDLDNILKAARLEPQDLFQDRSLRDDKRGGIAATYDYLDEQRSL